MLLNTGFAAPQFTDVVVGERVDLLIVDDEFDALTAGALAASPGLRVIRAWIDDAAGSDTVDGLIESHLGHRPVRPRRAGRIVLLTSGTTRNPELRSPRRVYRYRVPRRHVGPNPVARGESTVIAAPIFHAWGFGQVAVAATMTCTMVMTRRFDPRTTLDLARTHRAAGIAVVPVMLERIMDLPTEVLDQYRLPALRFVTASGSRMRPEAVSAFMDRFGDVVYNSYNATEAGLISTATPADLRAAPETAGRPPSGPVSASSTTPTGPSRSETSDGSSSPARSGFDGYTSGSTRISPTDT